MALHNTVASVSTETIYAVTPNNQRGNDRYNKPTLRFDFEGYSHRAIDWSLDGFRVQWHRVGSLREGDTFIIRGMAYGELETVPVFLRAEVLRIGQGQLAARFLDLNVQGRRLFNDFMARWAIFELAADIN